MNLKRRPKRAQLLSDAPDSTETCARSVRSPIDASIAPQRSEGYAASCVGVVAFLVFLRTLAPGLSFGDGPELAAAAYVLGVPHPTGYPLYMLLLHLWMKIPLGEIITRANLASAVCASLTASLSFLVWQRVIARVFADWPWKAHFLGAASIALLLAFLRNSWDNSVVVEVYAFQLLLTIAFLLFIQRYELSAEPRNLVFAAAWFGLGLAHHRLSVTFALPLLIAYRTAWRARGLARVRTAIAFGVGVIAVSLCLYAYLPVRAAAKPPINWGNAVTWSAFLDHVRGAQYMQFRLLQARPGRPFSLESYAEFFVLTLRHLVGDVAAQVLPVKTTPTTSPFPRSFDVPDAPSFVAGLVVIALAFFGFRRWWSVQRLTAAGALLAAAQNLVIVFIYNIEDIYDYYLFVMWLVWGSAGLALLTAVDIVRQQFATHLSRSGWAYSFLLIPLLPLAVNFSKCDMSKNDEPELFAEFVMPNRLAALPKNSILITSGDFDTFACWYRQIVRGDRSDVLVFGSNFASCPWYRAFFTPEQLEKYDIHLANGIVVGGDKFAQQLSQAIIKSNVGRFPLFTTIYDPVVLAELSKHYRLKLVAQQYFLVRGLSVPMLVTIRRIEPKRE